MNEDAVRDRLDPHTLDGTWEMNKEAQSRGPEYCAT